jgi:hypothetical protein
MAVFIFKAGVFTKIILVVELSLVSTWNPPGAFESLRHRGNGNIQENSIISFPNGR